MTARNMKLPKPVIPVICLLLLLHSKTMQAQLPVEAERLEQSRLVTRATMYGVGFTNVFDTYLSPQEYTGIDFRVSRESMRMTKWMDGKLSLQSFFQADLGIPITKWTTTIHSPHWPTGTMVCTITFPSRVTSSYSPAVLPT